MSDKFTARETKAINFWEAATPRFPGNSHPNIERMFEKSPETIWRSFYEESFGAPPPKGHTAERIKNAIRALECVKRGADARAKAR